MNRQLVTKVLLRGSLNNVSSEEAQLIEKSIASVTCRFFYKNGKELSHIRYQQMEPGKWVKTLLWPEGGTPCDFDSKSHTWNLVTGEIIKDSRACYRQVGVEVSFVLKDKTTMVFKRKREYRKS